MNYAELNEESAKSTITAAINSAYHTDLIVNSVEPAGAGVNTDGHFKALTSDGIYGIKTWLAAKPEDYDKEGCARRAETMNILAKILQCPDHCEAIVLHQHSLPCLQGYPVVITKWMQQGKSMAELASADSLTTTFYQKLGEWFAFGLALDYRDWASNNIVWQKDSEFTALIDLDWSLGAGLPTPYNCLSPFDNFTIPIKDKFSQHEKNLNNGIEQMRQKIYSHSAEVKKVAKDSKGANPNFKLIDIQGLEAKKLADWPHCI